MAQQEFDPIRAWQDFVQKWEIEINDWSGKITDSEQFSAVLGQATKLNMVAQKVWADRMEALLKTLKLPTETQLEALTERLDRMEDNIERIRLAIDRLAQPGAAESAPAPEPRRTRKPPQARG